MPETTVNRGQTLAKVPIFSGLAESELAFLTQHAVPRHYAAGEIVFGEGEPCLGLYVVESGHVRIFKSSSGGPRARAQRRWAREFRRGTAGV